jgi:hypothetical protein
MLLILFYASQLQNKCHICHHVCCIYGIITPNISDLVQYRILDTVVGAVLAFVANHFFMAFLGISKCANTSRKSNQSQSNLSSRNSYFYNKKGSISTSYRLAQECLY